MISLDHKPGDLVLRRTYDKLMLGHITKKYIGGKGIRQNIYYAVEWHDDTLYDRGYNSKDVDKMKLALEEYMKDYYDIEDEKIESNMDSRIGE